MSILIKGVEMPKNRGLFVVIDNGYVYVRPLGENQWEQLEEHAIELPPHGRLIDADAFIESERRLYCADCERRKGIRDGEVRIVHDIGDAPCLNCWTYDTLCDVEAFPTAEL